MSTHPTSLLIAGLLIFLLCIPLGMLVGGLFFERYRGDDEIGVADTHGRDQE